MILRITNLLIGDTPYLKPKWDQIKNCKATNLELFVSDLIIIIPCIMSHRDVCGIMADSRIRLIAVTLKEGGEHVLIQFVIGFKKPSFGLTHTGRGKKNPSSM